MDEQPLGSNTPTPPPTPKLRDIRKTCFVCTSTAHTGRWVHPCKCSRAIAHESCLLQYLTDNDLLLKRVRCPVCKEEYVLQLEKLGWAVRSIRLYEQIGKSLGKGVFWTLGTTIGGVGAVGLSIGLVSYGAWSIRMIFGERVYQDILSDSPSKWPISAFHSLPFTLPKILLAMAFRIPLNLPSFLAYPTNLEKISLSSLFKSKSSTRWSLSHFYPPSPSVFFTILLPLWRMLYSSVHKLARERVLGPETKRKRRRPGQLERRRTGLLRRILDEEDPPQREPEQGVNEPANDDQEFREPDDDESALSFLYRGASFFGRGLLLPLFANRMGALLHYTLGSYRLCRTLLAMERARPAVERIHADPHLHAFVTFFTGTHYWRSLEEVVWWRNMLGLGLGCAAYDAFTLAWEFWKRKELKSRRVKNRDFSGVEFEEGELIPVDDGVEDLKQN